MKRHILTATCAVVLGLVVLASEVPRAQGNNPSPAGCAVLPSWNDLKAALTAATAAPNGFLQNHMWGTIVDRSGVLGLDMEIAHVLADNRPILGLHQPVVVGMSRAGFRLFDQQLVQQFGHHVVDELTAIVGMEAPHHKGELGQNRLQNRQ